MSEMVERVARAIDPMSAKAADMLMAKGLSRKDVLAILPMGKARAAIEAMTLPEIDEYTFLRIEESAARKMRQWARGYAPQDIRIQHSLAWWIAKEVEAHMRAALSEELG